jgi:hypothetical protein
LQDAIEYLQVVLEPMVQLIQQLIAQLDNLCTRALKIVKRTLRFG